MNEFVDKLRKDLHAEITQYGTAGQAVFGQVIPKPRQPTPRQQLQNFLSMDTMSRQNMALEMGPEQYNKHVMDQIDNAANLLGPGAYQLIPYFQQDLTSHPSVPAASDVLNSLLGGAQDGISDSSPFTG